MYIMWAILDITQDRLNKVDAISAPQNPRSPMGSLDLQVLLMSRAHIVRHMTNRARVNNMGGMMKARNISFFKVQTKVEGLLTCAREKIKDTLHHQSTWLKTDRVL